MADLSFTSMLTKLNTRLKDSDDTTFTSSEKTEFLTTAIADEMVATLEEDSSLVSSSTTDTYALPSSISTVEQILMDGSDGFPRPLPLGSFVVRGGNIKFSYRLMPFVDNKTIYVRGKSKLTTADLIPEFLQDYVLVLAQIEAYEFMKSRFATRFLKNDVTMAELIASLNTLERKAQRLRLNLDNKYTVVD